MRHTDDVVFPCDLPNWPHIRTLLLTALKAPSVTLSLVSLNDASLCSQCPLGDDSDPRPRRNARERNVFSGLQKFLSCVATPEEKQDFFRVTLPYIIDCAVQIEARYPVGGLQYCRQQEGYDQVLSRQLAASIVACGFLCLWPERQLDRQSKLNAINFNQFFPHLTNPAQCAKLRCILHYFKCLAGQPDGPAGNLVFRRQVMTDERLPNVQDWNDCNQPLCDFHIHPDGKIEDSGADKLWVDFANKKLGGSVLCTGRVQEEVLFITCPELIAGMAFMENMEDNEAISVDGFGVFSQCSGYASELQFDGNFGQISEGYRDLTSRYKMCAIDALPGSRIGGAKNQYRERWLLRELNKAFLGFQQWPNRSQRPSSEESATLSEDFFSAAESLSDEGRTSMGDIEGFAVDLSDSIVTDAVRQASAELNRKTSPLASLFGTDQFAKRSRRVKERKKKLGQICSNCVSGKSGHLPRKNTVHVNATETRRNMSSRNDVTSSPTDRRTVRKSACGVETADDTQRDSVRVSSDLVCEDECLNPTDKSSTKSIGDAAKDVNTADLHLASVNKFADNLLFSVFKESCDVAAFMSPRMQGLKTKNTARVSAGRSSPNESDKKRSDSSDLCDGCVRRKVRTSPQTRKPKKATQHENDSEIPPTDVTHRGGYTFANDRQRELVAKQRLAVLERGRTRGQTDDDLSVERPIESTPVTARNGFHHFTPSPTLGQHPGESLSDDIKFEVMSGSGHSFDRSPTETIEPSSYSTPRRNYDYYNRTSLPNLHSSQTLEDHINTAVSSSDRISKESDSSSELDLDTIRLQSNGALSDSDDTKEYNRQRMENSHHIPPLGHSSNVIDFYAEVLSGEIFAQVCADLVDYYSLQDQTDDARNERKGEVDTELYNFADDFVQRIMQDARLIHRRNTEERLRRTNQLINELWIRPLERGRLNSLYFNAEFNLSKDVHLSKSRDSLTGRSREMINATASRRQSVDTVSRASHSSGSVGFRNAVLSDFEDELRRSSLSIPRFELLERVFKRRKSEPVVQTHGKMDLPHWLLDKKRARSEDITQTTNSSLLGWMDANKRLVMASPKKRTRRTTLTHLDWFVQDMLVDAFNDSFIEMFGEYYPLYDKKQNDTHPEQSYSSLVKSENERRFQRNVSKFAEETSTNIMSEARKEISSFSLSCGHDQSEDSDSFKDTYDFPYYELEIVATKFAQEIIQEALSVVRCHLRSANKVRPIATGNWGCGAYRGDPQLKALIQWIAASRAGAPAVHFYTFQNPNLHQLEEVVNVAREKSVAVGQLMSLVLQYCTMRMTVASQPAPTQLFDYLLAQLR